MLSHLPHHSCLYETMMYCICFCVRLPISPHWSPARSPIPPGSNPKWLALLVSYSYQACSHTEVHYGCYPPLIRSSQQHVYLNVSGHTDLSLVITKTISPSTCITFPRQASHACRLDLSRCSWNVALQYPWAPYRDQNKKFPHKIHHWESLLHDHHYPYLQVQ